MSEVLYGHANPVTGYNKVERAARTERYSKLMLHDGRRLGIQGRGTPDVLTRQEVLENIESFQAWVRDGLINLSPNGDGDHYLTPEDVESWAYTDRHPPMSTEPPFAELQIEQPVELAGDVSAHVEFTETSQSEAPQENAGDEEQILAAMIAEEEAKKQSAQEPPVERESDKPVVKQQKVKFRR